jgi:hypothetical protein
MFLEGDRLVITTLSLNRLSPLIAFSRACSGVWLCEQGDGTASIFGPDHPSVYTVSFHCHANFPFQKAVRRASYPILDVSSFSGPSISISVLSLPL